VSPLRDEKLQNRVLSNLNNRRFVLCAMLPVKYSVKLTGLRSCLKSIIKAGALILDFKQLLRPVSFVIELVDHDAFHLRNVFSLSVCLCLLLVRSELVV